VLRLCGVSRPKPLTTRGETEAGRKTAVRPHAAKRDLLHLDTAHAPRKRGIVTEEINVDDHNLDTIQGLFERCFPDASVKAACAVATKIALYHELDKLELLDMVSRFYDVGKPNVDAHLKEMRGDVH